MVEPSPATLGDWIEDARSRTLRLVDDLSDEQLRVPQLDTVNPLLWEIGHVCWFQERWVLRETLGRDPLEPWVDDIYDSMAIAHDTRWDLELPSRRQTLDYMERVKEAVLAALADDPTPELRFHVRYTLHHEDMHDEAFTYTRQTLGYPAPQFATGSTDEGVDGEAGALAGDVEIDGGDFRLGAERIDPDAEDRFVFDNEKWAHTIRVEPFAIARAPVTQSEFAAFVDDGGYERRRLWSEAGWEWRRRADAEQPVYWRRGPDGWERRRFDRWLALEPHRPVVHVNWHEAQAWCRWAGRRLPTEAEWEMAATTAPNATRPAVPEPKRRYPWGDDVHSADRANLAGADGVRGGCVDVGALAAGDSACGCRQLLGNVWEWTASVFEPYPGFTPDPYREYSEPWFGDRRVLRGGSWATPARLVWNTMRNFFTPDRRDVFAGFRTCAR